MPRVAILGAEYTALLYVVIWQAKKGLQKMPKHLVTFWYCHNFQYCSWKARTNSVIRFSTAVRKLFQVQRLAADCGKSGLAKGTPRLYLSPMLNACKAEAAEEVHKF